MLEERANAEAALDSKMSDIETYFHLAQEESDDGQRKSILEDVAKEIAAADKYLCGPRNKTLLAGESDRLNAIITIKPGAGGTESQDWAEMLLRMYLRWAEEKGLRPRARFNARRRGGHQDRHASDRGRERLRHLAGESGVHRLVRISPFDSSRRRHTSFASVFVIPEIDDRIEIVVQARRICALTPIAPAGKAARTSTRSRPRSASPTCPPASSSSARTSAASTRTATSP